jgi:hypothetical protein
MMERVRRPVRGCSIACSPPQGMNSMPEAERTGWIGAFECVVQAAGLAAAGSVQDFRSVGPNTSTRTYCRKLSFFFSFDCQVSTGGKAPNLSFIFIDLGPRR